MLLRVDRIPRWALIAAAVVSLCLLVGTIVAINVPHGASAEFVLPPSASPSPSPSVPAPVQRVFPVQGQVSYEHDHHGYPATDIMAACGTPVVAVYSGVILEVNRIDSWDPATDIGVTRGGLSVSLLGDDGVRYYGSHFSKIFDNIQPGVRVNAGDRLALVGETGDASACHVHFGLSPKCFVIGDWWIRRGMIWPWKYLDAWRGGQNLDPTPEIQQYQATNGCPDHPLVEP
jgi:murein DD-endopeptidase MepM/ murein hydrolase activator NlpD